ncbi:MAG TPA: ATP-binding protein, partial [Sphingomicrobium sp.]
MNSEQPLRPSVWTLSILAGAICVILISLLGYLQWHEARVSSALRASIEHSSDRQSLVGSYLSLLQDSETGQRGYIVTGNREFLQPFDRAMRDIGQSERAVEQLYPVGDPARTAALRLLRIGRLRVDHAADNVRLASQGDQAAAMANIRSGIGNSLMNEARRLAVELIERENAASRRISVEGNRAAVARQRTMYLTEIALLLALLILVSGLFQTVRGLKTQAAQLRDSATRQAAIFENATDAMMMLDAKGTIEAVNTAAETLFGRERESLVGTPNLSLFAEPPSPETRDAYLKRLADGRGTGVGRQDFVGRKGDGSEVVVEVVTTPIRLEDGLHFLAIARDATERRRVEQLKSEFVATVSHELRTPLTSIAGSLGLLSGGAAGELPAKAARLVEIAHGNSERLIRLINDILDIEKIEAGKMTFDLRPLAVCHLLDLATQANQDYAARHQVTIEFEGCPPGWRMTADQDRFMQVMANLLSNAVKFSPVGGIVRLTAKELGKSIRISVIDQGQGIDKEFQSRIFGKFAQADSTDTRQKSGTGLGLSIVRELVERMGGRVSFESEAGQGTTFMVDLTAASPAPTDELPGSFGRLADSD